jgi:hypothetical protein
MTGRRPRHLGVLLGEAVQQVLGRLAGTDPGMAHGQQVRDVPQRQLQPLCALDD